MSALSTTTGSTLSEEDFSEDAANSMEQTVERLLGPGLEATAWRLKSLHESQELLSRELAALTIKLRRYVSETANPVGVQATITKIDTTRRRLNKICATLVVVEKRLDKSKMLLLNRCHRG